MQEVSTAKNTHVNELLAQTDQCLQSLFNRLTASTGVISHKPTGAQSAALDCVVQSILSRAENRGRASGGDQMTWDDLTFSTDIPAAPSTLTGELRDYQLQAREYATASKILSLHPFISSESPQ